MKKYIMGNFKMNFNKQQLKDYLEGLKSLLSESKNEVVIFPPYTVLDFASQKTSGSNILLGGQNVNENEEGAFTGEISVKMLKDFNVSYVLVGHSERRKLFYESNKKINQKLKALLKYGVKPVLCVGETEKENLQGKTNQVLTTQIQEALKGIYENELSSIVVAYEPVWAIGTGKSANEKDVLKRVQHIRKVVKQNYSKQAADNLVVLYGGSIKSLNAKSYLSNKEINGALIGGASLNAEEFAKIILEN